MLRPPIYNAFMRMTPNHHSHGFWRTPEGAIQYKYNELQSYVDVAKTLERGRIDAMFLADVVGVYDLDFGDGKTAIRAGSEFPGPDPLSAISALGYATENLGFAVTSNLIQSHPFTFARQMSTLDEFTHGRVAWNIVTSYLSNGFRNYGYDDIAAHGSRYEWAQEYADVTYKLWEKSWEEGAILHRPETSEFFDASKVHTIDHVGPRYSVQGPHIVEPSPQRTPVLFQAGASADGRAFAVRNAEVTFLASVTPEAAKADILALNQAARAAGREPSSLKKIVSLSTIIGSTEEEAQRKRAYFRENIDISALQAFSSGAYGIDFAMVDPKTTLEEIATLASTKDHVRSILRAAIDANVGGQGGKLTWSEYLLDHGLLPGRFAGTPEQIADVIQEWVDAGVDGFNLIPTTTLGFWDEWVDNVVPVLQKRGLAQVEYEPGTLRHKLFRNGDTIPADHRARNMVIGQRI